MMVLQKIKEIHKKYSTSVTTLLTIECTFFFVIAAGAVQWWQFNNSLFPHELKNMRFDRKSTIPQSKPVLSKSDRRLSNLEFIQQTINNKPIFVSFFDK